MAYLLWILGFQHAYIGKWGLLVLYWVTLGGVMIWAIVDLFRIPGMIADYNKDSAVDILRNIKAVQ